MNTIGTMQVSMDDMLQTTPAAVVEPSTDVEEDDFFTPEMLAEIDRRADDYYSGRDTGRVLTPELLKELFGDL